MHAKNISGDRISSTKLQKNAISTSRLHLHTSDSAPKLSVRIDTKLGNYALLKLVSSALTNISIKTFYSECKTKAGV